MEPYLNFPYDMSYLSHIIKKNRCCKVVKKNHYYSLGIGLSTRCNFKCPFCYYRQGNKIPINDISLRMLSKIIEDMPILASVIIGLEGEPLCYPYFFEALDIISLKTDGFNIVSNGDLLTKNICKKISTYPIFSFILSIDGGDKPSYEKYRVGGTFHKFLKNCTFLLDYLGDRTSFHSVIFSENVNSLVEIPELASQLGISKISFQQLRTTINSASQEITRISQKNLEYGLKSIIDKAIKYNIFIYFDSCFGNKYIMNMLYELSRSIPYIKIKKQKRQKCSQIYQYTSVMSDGRIFPCCGNFTPADIYSYSFDGIYNHNYLKLLRTVIYDNTKIEPCMECKSY